MDPATHALFGAALVFGAASRPARRTVVTCAAASLLPDIDCVVMPTGWDRYLVVHEVGTHSLAGALLLGALLGLAVTRGFRGAASVWVASVAGAVGHVFWDVANGGDIRLFWPAGQQRVGGHLVAMADPIVLVPLLCFGAVAWRRRHLARGAAALVLMALAGILVAKLGLQQRALEAHARAAGPGVERRAIEARWGTLAAWSVYDLRGPSVRAWNVTSSGHAELRTAIPADAPLARAAAAHAAPARRALALWDFAFARAIPDGAGRDVLVSDPRFCSDDACALWFGGRQDRAGRFTREVVIVGGWRLERPLP